MTDLFLDALRTPAASAPCGAGRPRRALGRSLRLASGRRFPSLTDSAVRRHLEAENRYTDAVLAPLAPLKQVLRNQLAERIDPKEHGVPLAQHRGHLSLGLLRVPSILAGMTSQG